MKTWSTHKQSYLLMCHTTSKSHNWWVEEFQLRVTWSSSTCGLSSMRSACLGNYSRGNPGENRLSINHTGVNCCVLNFALIISFQTHGLHRKYHDAHFTDEGTKVQKSKVTCEQWVKSDLVPGCDGWPSSNSGSLWHSLLAYCSVKWKN